MTINLFSGLWVSFCFANKSICIESRISVELSASGTATSTKATTQKFLSPRSTVQTCWREANAQRGPTGLAKQKRKHLDYKTGIVAVTPHPAQRAAQAKGQEEIWSKKPKMRRREKQEKTSGPGTCWHQGRKSQLEGACLDPWMGQTGDASSDLRMRLPLGAKLCLCKSNTEGNTGYGGCFCLLCFCLFAFNEEEKLKFYITSGTSASGTQLAPCKKVWIT